MTPQDAAQAEKILRDFITENPRIVLDAPDVMRALLATHDETLGQNIVDLRSVAMRRLEAQLGRLEETNRSVIAAAYDNLAGTQQIHRALLKIMEPTDFGGFLTIIGTEMVDILRIDYACLILETQNQSPDPNLAPLGPVVKPAPPGFMVDYLSQNLAAKVTLRRVTEPNVFVYPEAIGPMGSEACLQLDFGAGTLPGLLILAAKDAEQFSPAQGTDLLTFFATIFERALRRWLA
jgi:uncharacterized protein YigA (DUF484 family)